MNEVIIISHITAICIGIFIIAIACLIDAYADYKYYKLYERDCQKRWTEEKLEQMIKNIDIE